MERFNDSFAVAWAGTNRGPIEGSPERMKKAIQQGQRLEAGWLS